MLNNSTIQTIGCAMSLALIGVVAISDCRAQVRWTFEFYAVDGIRVEERLMRTGDESKEREIQSYIEEMLYGPMSPDLMPLFPVGTRVLSVLYRNEDVYINMSEDAVLLQPDIFQSVQLLDSGIRRNFPVLKQIKIFIAGHEIQNF
ncbi:hypothetical protein FACS1894172_11470 [Spirochaetia bacterium]|nr:hypothetical protein FACS1894172_11470 [Spirochaetia bacterium]